MFLCPKNRSHNWVNEARKEFRHGVEKLGWYRATVKEIKRKCRRDSKPCYAILYYILSIILNIIPISISVISTHSLIHQLLNFSFTFISHKKCYTMVYIKLYLKIKWKEMQMKWEVFFQRLGSEISDFSH